MVPPGGFLAYAATGTTSGSTVLQQQGSVIAKVQADLLGVGWDMLITEGYAELAPALAWASWGSCPWEHFCLCPGLLDVCLYLPLEVEGEVAQSQ